MRFFAFFAFLVAATIGIGGSSASAAVVVSPGNMGNWTFSSTDDSGDLGTGTATGAFVNGPSTPPLGTGSFNLKTSPGAGDGSAQLRNSDWTETKLADITSLGYSTFVTSFNGAQVPYLTLYVDSDGNGSQDDRLFFEPEYSNGGYGNGDPNPQDPVATGVWQTWDALHGMWYSDNGSPDAFGFLGIPNTPGAYTITWDQYITAFPLAKLVIDETHLDGSLRLTSGFASPGDNFNTNVDAFTIGVDGNTVTYDFELAGPVPEPATLTLWSLGVLGLAAARLRRRNSNA